MTEKKIYSPWAYTKNEAEKSHINKQIYDELHNEYKICFWYPTRQNQKSVNLEDYVGYDVILQYVGSGSAHTRYKVIQNIPKLSADELALLCDKGNLCFGYSIRNGEICVYTD